MHGLYLLFVVGAVALPASSSSSCENTLTTTETVTGEPSTVTETATTTSVNTNTFEYYLYSTTTTAYYIDTTFIDPTPATVTVTSTSTSYSTTSTISAPGFTPVQSSLPGSKWEDLETLQNQDQDLAKRDVEEIVARAAQPGESPKPSYCATTTVTATNSPGTVTTTVTETFSTYTNIEPTVTGTYTFEVRRPNPTSTDTFYDPPSSVIIKTSATGSSTSVYAACATDNWTDSYHYNGYDAGPVGAYEANNKQDENAYIGLNVTSPYDCCVAALTQSDERSAIWQYFHNPQYEFERPGGVFGDNTHCRILLQPKDVCAVTGQNTTNWQFPVYYGVSAGFGFVIGNGLCGKINDISVIG